MIKVAGENRLSDVLCFFEIGFVCMKLEEIVAAMIRDAIREYLDIAYEMPEERRRHWPEFDLGGDVRGWDLLENFIDESHYTEDVLSHRYVLRLGNVRYPHMKFVVEEYVVPGHYYIAVDTHDNYRLSSDNPDYVQWIDLRKFNLEQKDAVEARWTEMGLPTMRNVRMAVNGETAIIKPTRQKVLVVDDEPEMAETSRLMLVDEGYDVTVVYNGRDAVEAARSNPPDIVLLDIQMPGRDGYEVCELLRGDPVTKDIPILLATAAPGEMIYTMQANGFLSKPYNRRILTSFVEHIIRNSIENLDAQ